MDDNQIVELYLKRSETAIDETKNKYDRYCHYIAYQILRNDEDAVEITNDTYLKVWETIPPNHPDSLKGYVGMICNQLAINRYDKQTADKRGGGQVTLVLDEIAECISNDYSDIINETALQNVLNKFLWSLPKKTRNIFVRRYWYVSSIAEIAKDYGMKESSVSVLMLRTRKKLKRFLQKEGFEL